MTAIQVRGLRKSYGAIEAVRGIDLDVEEGEVFGLLGPNGAGKTTTVEILEGYRQRSAGEVTVLGHDPAKADRDLKERIGIVLQETGVERYLNVTEVVDLLPGLLPQVPPRRRAAGPHRARSQARPAGEDPVRRPEAAPRPGPRPWPATPSCSSSTSPPPASTRPPAGGPGTSISGLRALGKTILLTTHYMDEAQVLADRVAVIVGGVIVAEGPPDNLAGSERATEIHFTLPPGTGADALPELAAPATVTVEGGAVLVTVPDPTQALNTLTGWALGPGPHPPRPHRHPPPAGGRLPRAHQAEAAP